MGIRSVIELFGRDPQVGDLVEAVEEGNGARVHVEVLAVLDDGRIEVGYPSGVPEGRWTYAAEEWTPAPGTTVRRFIRLLGG